MCTPHTALQDLAVQQSLPFQPINKWKVEEGGNIMNILLWVLQGLLAFWNLTGGAFTIMNHEKIKGGMWGNNLPTPVWMILGVLQILFALGIILPGIVGMMPKLVSIAAIYLAVNSLLGCTIFSQYAGFPGMLWGLVPATLAAFVAYGRCSS